jgi:hypothetical protein
MANSNCLSTPEIIAQLTGTTPPDDRPRIASHLTECAQCRQQITQGQHALFRSYLRTTLWIIGIGVFVGGPAVLGFSIACVAKLLDNLGKVYSHFPSVAAPLLATSSLEPIPTLSLVACGLFAAISWYAMGWFVAAIVRPSGIISCAALSLFTGLIAGITAYAGGLGWAMGITLAILPSLDDMKVLADGYERHQHPATAEASQEPKPHPQEQLVEKYPDLTEVQEKDRAGYLFGKIVADQVVGSYAGIIWGIILALGFYGLTGLAQGVIGGYLRRRGDSWYGSLLPYFELSLPASLLCSIGVLSLVIVVVLSRGLREFEVPRWGWSVFFAAWLVVAAFAVAYRWPFWARWGFYSAWFVALGHLLMDLWTIPDEISPLIDVAIMGVGLLLAMAGLAWKIVRRRLDSVPAQAAP